MCDQLIELNEKGIRDHLEKREWRILEGILRNSFTVERKGNDLILKKPSKNSINVMSDCLAATLETTIANQEDELLLLLKELFKTLRNCAAAGTDVQNLIASDENILKNTKKLLILLSKENYECVNMQLQFLVNLVIKNCNTAHIIWNLINEELPALLQNSKLVHYASALFYNILLLDSELIPQCDSLFKILLDVYVPNDEFVMFLLILYIKERLHITYAELKCDHSFIFLEIIFEHIKTNEHLDLITLQLMQKFSFEFKRKSDCILKTVDSYLSKIEPREVCLLLQIIASVSSHETYFNVLKNDKSLLINCAYLLKSIHSLGKQSNNDFTSINKLSELNADDFEDHPVFGFKVNLVRILGNLCWKNKENQDLLRELDCISLLLDCCNIDARNPFIMQWVIFAVRNLSENNLENQAFIASLNQQGTVPTSTLEQFGITLHNDGSNEVKIVPLDALKK